MKVVLDNIIYSLQQSGGISTVWSQLLQRILKCRDFQCTVLEYDNADKNILHTDNCLNTIKRHSYRITRFLNDSIELHEPFIFHSSYFRICNSPNAINICTIHDFIHEKGYYKGVRRFINSHIKRRAIFNSDYVICVSQNTRHDLLDLFPQVAPDKVKVVYNAASEAYHIIDDKSYTHSLPFPPQSYLLVVGKRENYKRFDIVIEAARLSGLNIVAVGQAFSKAELKMIGTFHSHCRCLANITDSHLNQLYNSAFALAYPSLYEGFGLPVIEAQKAGCPVIALRASSIPEVIGDDTLLMNIPDAKEMLRCIKRCADNTIRTTVIDRGLQNTARFNWDNAAREVISIYTQAYTAHQIKSSL